MSNLKVTEEEIIAELGSRVSDAVESVRRAAEDAIGQVREVAKTLREVEGKMASDLLLASRVAWVKEITLPERSHAGAYVEGNYGRWPIHDQSVDFPGGKYRVLLFFLPVKE